jgi:hypothetical protein
MCCPFSIICFAVLVWTDHVVVLLRILVLRMLATPAEKGRQRAARRCCEGEYVATCYVLRNCNWHCGAHGRCASTWRGGWRGGGKLAWWRGAAWGLHGRYNYFGVWSDYALPGSWHEARGSLFLPFAQLRFRPRRPPKFLSPRRAAAQAQAQKTRDTATQNAAASTNASTKCQAASRARASR